MFESGLTQLTVKTVEVTPDPQLKAALDTPHEPLLDFRVKPEPMSISD
jgi:hypothetical protein